jgi:hypothetical protein
VYLNAVLFCVAFPWFHIYKEIEKRKLKENKNNLAGKW